MTILFAGLLGGCGTPVDPAATVPRSNTEVVFDSQGFTLEGNLVVPEHASDEVVPAVVLVHGSGPNSRDVPASGQLNLGFGFSIDIFRQVSTELVREGIAVLRYDKRTCSSTNGCENDYPSVDESTTVDDFVADARSAVAFLATQDDIDVDRIFLVGHSQGGSFVPIVAADMEDLAGGVILAGPFQTIDVLLRYQLDFSRDLLIENGSTEESAKAQLTSLRGLVEDVEAIAAGTFQGTSAGGGTVEFWESWIRVGEEAKTAALDATVPLLALGGDYDWNVPPAEIEAWGDHLEGSTVGHQATVLPCITHALNCIGQPDWQQITQDDIGRRVDTTVTDAIADWVGLEHL
ncbi:MAG: alpha/beta fold hydrolase [Myxococcota bacterium]